MSGGGRYSGSLGLQRPRLRSVTTSLNESFGLRLCELMRVETRWAPTEQMLALRRFRR